MKYIDEYTVVDILNSYKKIIGADIEKVASLVFLDNSKKRRMFKEEMDGIMQEKGLDTKNDNYDKFREEIVFNEIVNNFSLNIDLNYDNEVKLALLSEIYRRFAKKMTEKEKREITDTILGEKNSYAIFKYDSEEYDGISDYAIITRYREEKLKSVHNEVLRDCIKSAIEQTVEIDNIESVMKQGISEQIYNVIMEKLLIKFFLEDQRMDLKEFKNNSDNNSFNDILLENPEMEEEFKELLVDYFSNNLQYLDKNLLLLNSAALSILAVEMIKGRKVEELKLGNFDLDKEKSRVMAESISFIKDIYNEISKRKYDDVEYSIKTEEGEKIITVSKELISEFLSRCTKNDYLSDEDIKQIHDSLLQGVLEPDIQKRKIANLSVEDLIEANKVYEAKEEKDESEEKLKTCILDLIQYLKDERKISDEEIINMYLKNKISIELITDIDMPEISDEYYLEKFKELYNENVFLAEDEKEEKNNMLQRMSELYIQLENIGKVNIDRDELIGYFIDLYGHDYAIEILDELNDLNIIDIKKAIEWVGIDILSKKYEKGQLKPVEVRNFYKDGTINLDEIANIVNKLSDNGDKFMLIGSIFPEETEEDREIRDLLIDECLRIDSEIENNKLGNKRKKGREKTGDYYKHITDPFARMSLIQALDEDYSFEMTSDGHAVVKLPNLKSVVIEKMLDKNKEPSYGAATYILDEQDYDNNRFAIKRDGKINRQETLKLIKPEQKIVHLINTWGENLKNYFINNQEPNWDEENLNAIDEAIERVKRSDKKYMDKYNDKELAKMILNLITTKKATLEQVQEIAQIYGVDLEKVMDSLEER